MTRFPVREKFHKALYVQCGMAHTDIPGLPWISA